MGMESPGTHMNLTWSALCNGLSAQWIARGDMEAAGRWRGEVGCGYK